MLDSIKRNKMHIVVWTVLFGVAGALIIPVILGIRKLSKKFPKACKYTIFTICCLVTAVCIYCILMKHQINFVPVCICSVLAIYRIVKK